MDKNSLESPILILTCKHSGSSMLTEIFEGHGVWTGNLKTQTSHKHPRGVRQNADIDEFLGDNFARNKSAKKHPIGTYMADPKVKLKDFVKSLNPQPPYLFKFGVACAEVWDEFESPIYITARRNRNAIVQSNAEGFGNTLEDTGIWVDYCIKGLEAVEKKLNAIPVWYDKLFDRDYSDLEKAFAACGLKFDPAVADKVIDPDFRHHV